MRKIVVVGSANIDLVARVEEMPRKGETIRAISYDQIPGGKGANQACAAGKLGGDCTFLGMVGNDGLSELLLDSLRGSNVDISHVETLDGVSTGTAIITVNAAGENSIIIIAGANAMCGQEYFAKNRAVLDAADIVLTQLEIPLDDVYQMLQDAKKCGKVTILNPAPAPSSLPDEVLASLDYITPNETELASITGMPTDTMEEISAAAEMLLQKGVKNVIVTVGSRGAYLCNDNEHRLFPAMPVSPVDTTAAGDTFNAGLAVALAEGRVLADAIVFANASAALSVTRKGAQTSVPSRDEVDHFLSERSEENS